jgi:hypothetical protein
MTDGHSRARSRLLEICERIRGGTPINHACALEDVPRSSFYALREADPEADHAVLKAIAFWSEAERQRIEKALDAGDPKTANVRLHRIGIRDPDNYAPPPKRVEQTGKDGGPVKTEVTVRDAVDGLSEEELMRAAKGLIK